MGRIILWWQVIVGVFHDRNVCRRSGLYDVLHLKKGNSMTILCLNLGYAADAG